MKDIIDQPTYDALVDAVGADFIDELLQAYYEETPALLATLQQALTNLDFESFTRAAHSIKSTSNSFGAFQFAELAKELEMMGKAKNLEGAQAKVDHLTQDYLQVRLSLEGLAHGK
jgi:HPt (histidine-containing phosphotransfer) domain-containing protein